MHLQYAYIIPAKYQMNILKALGGVDFTKVYTILKPSSNRSPNIFTIVQKVKIGHTKRFDSKDKSRLCRDFAGYFISN